MKPEDKTVQTVSFKDNWTIERLIDRAFTKELRLKKKEFIELLEFLVYIRVKFHMDWEYRLLSIQQFQIEFEVEKDD